jgi:hypothetical protein
VHWFLYVEQMADQAQNENLQYIQYNDADGNRNKELETSGTIRHLIILSDQVQEHPDDKAKLNEKQHKRPGCKKVVLLVQIIQHSVAVECVDDCGEMFTKGYSGLQT